MHEFSGIKNTISGILICVFHLTTIRLFAVSASILVVATIFTPAASSGQSQPPKSSNSHTKGWLLSLPQANIVSVNKILGKPASTDGDAALRESSYARKGFKEIGVLFLKGKCESVEVVFVKAPTTWKDAVTLCGLDASKVTGKLGTAQNGSEHYDLNGLVGLPKKWSATYFPETTLQIGEGEAQPVPARLSLYGPEAM